MVPAVAEKVAAATQAPPPVSPLAFESAPEPKSPNDAVATVEPGQVASVEALPVEHDSTPLVDAGAAGDDEAASLPPADALEGLPVALAQSEPTQFPEAEATSVEQTEVTPAVEVSVVTEADVAAEVDPPLVAEMDRLADADEADVADELLPVTGWLLADQPPPSPPPSPVTFDPASVARLQSLVAATVSAATAPGAVAAPARPVVGGAGVVGAGVPAAQPPIRRAIPIPPRDPTKAATTTGVSGLRPLGMRLGDYGSAATTAGQASVRIRVETAGASRETGGDVAGSTTTDAPGLMPLAPGLAGIGLLGWAAARLGRRRVRAPRR